MANQLLKQSKFLKKAHSMFGDRYDYSKSYYVDSSIPVTIICSIHGKFTQRPNDHLRKGSHGCPRCGKTASNANRLIDETDLIDRFNDVHKSLYDYSNLNFTNTNSNVTIKCSKHGIFDKNTLL